MSDIREDLGYLSRVYRNDEYIAIREGDKNYFQEALDEINRLRGIVADIEGVVADWNYGHD